MREELLPTDGLNLNGKVVQTKNHANQNSVQGLTCSIEAKMAKNNNEPTSNAKANQSDLLLLPTDGLNLNGKVVQTKNHANQNSVQGLTCSIEAKMAKNNNEPTSNAKANQSDLLNRSRW
jgi:hypothetical protein